MEPTGLGTRASPEQTSYRTPGREARSPTACANTCCPATAEHPWLPYSKQKHCAPSPPAHASPSSPRGQAYLLPPEESHRGSAPCPGRLDKWQPTVSAGPAAWLSETACKGNAASRVNSPGPSAREGRRSHPGSAGVLEHLSHPGLAGRCTPLPPWVSGHSQAPLPFWVSEGPQAPLPPWLVGVLMRLSHPGSSAPRQSPGQDAA